MKKLHYTFNKNRDLGENFLFYEATNDTYICTCGCHGKHTFNETDNRFTECPQCKTKARIRFNAQSAGDISLTKRYIDEIEYDNTGFHLKENVIKFGLQLEVYIQNQQPTFGIVKDSLEIKSITERLDLQMNYVKNKNNKTKLVTEYRIDNEKCKFTQASCINLYGDCFFEHATITNALSRVSCISYESYNLYNIYRTYKHAPDLMQAGYSQVRGTVQEIRALNNLYLNPAITPVFDQMIDMVRTLTTANPLTFSNFSYIFNYNYKEQSFNIDEIKYALSLDVDALKELKNEISIRYMIQYFYKLKYTPEEANYFLALAIRQNVTSVDLFLRHSGPAIDILSKYDVKIEKTPKDVQVLLDKINLINKLQAFDTKTRDLNEFNLSMQNLVFQDGVEFLVKYACNSNKDFFNTITDFAIQQLREGKAFAKLSKNGKYIENCIVEIDRDKFHTGKIEKIHFENNVYENENEIEDILSKLSMEVI